MEVLSDRRKPPSGHRHCSGSDSPDSDSRTPRTPGASWFRPASGGALSFRSGVSSQDYEDDFEDEVPEDLPWSPQRSPGGVLSGLGTLGLHSCEHSASPHSQDRHSHSGGNPYVASPDTPTRGGSRSRGDLSSAGLGSAGFASQTLSEVSEIAEFLADEDEDVERIEARRRAEDWAAARSSNGVPIKPLCISPDFFRKFGTAQRGGTAGTASSGARSDRSDASSVESPSAIRDDLPQKVISGLYIGSVEAANNRRALRQCAITHVLTLGFGMEPMFPDALDYRIVEILDERKEHEVRTMLPPLLMSLLLVLLLMLLLVLLTLTSLPCRCWR